MSTAVEYLAIRIPSALKRQIEQEAAQTNVSINTLIKEILDTRYYPKGAEPLTPFLPNARRKDATDGRTA